MDFLRKTLLDGSVLQDLDASDLGTIFEQTLDHIVFRGLLAAEDRQRVEEALLEREEQVSTAVWTGHIGNSRSDTWVTLSVRWMLLY